MSDLELQPVIGAIENGVAFVAPPLVNHPTHLYVIVEKSNHWTYERLALNVGPLVLQGKSGRAANSEQAQEWIQEDWKRHRNYILWANYMATNPPPG